MTSLGKKSIMKNLFLLCSIITVVLLSSCNKNDLPEELICDEECLFTLESIEGSMYKMDCFDRYGIQFDNTTDTEDPFFYVIPDKLDSTFEVQDKRVVVRGICRTNTLKPLFPDPFFNMEMLFQAELVDIKEAD